MADAIGKCRTLKEDERGLYFEGKLTLTRKVKDYLMLMKDKVTTAGSVGFDPVKWWIEERVRAFLR